MGKSIKLDFRCVDRNLIAETFISEFECGWRHLAARQKTLTAVNANKNREYFQQFLFNKSPKFHRSTCPIFV